MEEERVTFLADECTFTRTIHLMEHVGCEVERVQGLGMGGASDDEVFQVAHDRGMVLVTTDKGFGDVRMDPPSSHHGILVLKGTPDPEQIQSVHRTLSTLLESEEQFEGTLFIVDAQKYRKRRSP